MFIIRKTFFITNRLQTNTVSFVLIRARSQIPAYGLTGRGLGRRAAGWRRRAWDFTGKILE